MFNKMSISAKLISSFLFTVAVTVAVGLIGWSSINQLSEIIDDYADQKIPSLRACLNISEALMDIKAAQRSLLIPNLEKKRIEDQYRYIDEGFKAIDEEWKVYEATTKVNGEKEIWNKFVTSYERWRQEHEKFMGLIKQYFSTNDSTLCSAPHCQDTD